MVGKPLIFVSSASDLSADRAALAAGLSSVYELYSYDQDRAQRTTPERRCRQMITRCDVFIGLLGCGYGTPYLRGIDERSIVEWEYDMARERPDLEILTFVRRTRDGTVIDPRQKRLIDRLTDFQQGFWCRFYASPEELVTLVRSSLENWLVEFWAARHEAGRGGMARWLDRVIHGVAGAFVLALLLIVVPSLQKFSTNSIVAVSALVTCAVALCLLLLLGAKAGGRIDISGLVRGSETHQRLLDARQEIRRGRQRRHRPT